MTLAAVRAARVDELLERRVEASDAFFAAEAERIAHACRRLADAFAAGGRLLAIGSSPQSWSDAHHVAVEFVHPVIVGKRALPALAVAAEHVEALAAPADVVCTFDGGFTLGDETFRPPAEDPFVAQEIVETLYHVLWELVHVFLEGGSRSGDAGGAAAGFLYPFLEDGARDGDALVEDVRRSVLMKADEVSALRRQTLGEGREELAAAADAVRGALDAGGTVLAFGNGGSATDAMDLVADLRGAPQGFAARRALDLTADSAILTALANDVGPETLFARQVIAYGRSGDVLVALSTSGGSANVVAALAEARRRSLLTVAFVGYDGGRVAAERLADHVVVSRSQHVPRIQEAQASAYHVLRELIELVGSGEG